ncbi:MAG: hypothetical protein KatS3mg104_2960 [Phycisphaerae bacterium]|nr:MAG: hypothetical protein KatS3mg104_2960 [Phycisphaerae bacterium]
MEAVLGNLKVILAAIVGAISTIVVGYFTRRSTLDKTINERIDTLVSSLSNEISYWRTKYMELEREVNELRFEVLRLKYELDRYKNGETA